MWLSTIALIVLDHVSGLSFVFLHCRHNSRLEISPAMTAQKALFEMLACVIISVPYQGLLLGVVKKFF